MNFTPTKKKYITQLWKQQRRQYLEDAHTTEKEVIKTHRKREEIREYFYLDGYRIWMPEELYNVDKFYRHLMKNIDK